MSATSISDFYELKIFTNFNLGGFSESYHLPDASIANVKADSVLLTNFRTTLYANGFSCAGVTLSKWSKFKDRYKIGAYRASAINIFGELISTIAPCNDPEVGPMWRFDTLDGRFVNRTIRGVRDAWITNNAAAITAVTLAADAATARAYTSPPAALTAVQTVIDRYISMVYWLTRHITILTSSGYTAGVRTMSGVSRTWEEVSYRRLGSHDVGQRYGVGRGRQAAWS